MTPVYKADSVVPIVSIGQPLVLPDSVRCRVPTCARKASNKTAALALRILTALTFASVEYALCLSPSLTQEAAAYIADIMATTGTMAATTTEATTTIPTDRTRVVITMAVTTITVTDTVMDTAPQPYSTVPQKAGSSAFTSLEDSWLSKSSFLQSICAKRVQLGPTEYEF